MRKIIERYGFQMQAQILMKEMESHADGKE